MKKATIFQTTITKISFVFTCVLFLSLGAHANNPDGAEGEGDNRMKIRLKFNSVNGFDRDITVLADENATGEFDSEFDSEGQAFNLN